MNPKDKASEIRIKDDWKAVEVGAATLFQELPSEVQQQYGPDVHANTFVLDKHLFD